MKCGQDHLDTRSARLLVKLHGNATAVIRYRDAVVDMDGHFDAITRAGQRLVDAVIDNLKHEMV
jgi:hypothetical protein